MKSSIKGHRPRARFSRFISAPPSVMEALRSLRNASAQAVFNFLIEKCFGFGQGSVELSYGQIAKAIGRSWRTVARVAHQLRVLGVVAVESLTCGAFRWRIPVLAKEVKEDPLGVLLVVDSSASQSLPHPIPIPSGYDRTDIPPHDKFVIPPMTDLSWGVACEGLVLNPDFMGDCASFEELENGPSKRHDQKTSLKRHHQLGDVSVTENVGSKVGDDEFLDHKKLFGKLLELGMKQRVARKLLRENEHKVIFEALRRVAQRGDVENPAGYVVCEVQDGGYEDVLATDVEVLVDRSKPGLKTSDAPMVSLGVERTRSEMRALEMERQAREAVSRSQTQVLVERFSSLSGELKAALRERWSVAKEALVPNTPRRLEILRDPRFEKMAFREVTSRFFAALDGGASEEAALAGVV